MNSRTGLVAGADQRAVDHVAERAEALGDRAEDAIAFARIGLPAEHTRNRDTPAGVADEDSPQELEWQHSVVRTQGEIGVSPPPVSP